MLTIIESPLFVLQAALVLLVIYAKNVGENIPADVLRRIAKEMGHAT